jgi:CHASE2 domain-containing sensor protein
VPSNHSNKGFWKNSVGLSLLLFSATLDNKIPADALKDKIVLIGGTAPSLQDYRLLPNEMKRFGVEYHAYFVSQLLNTAIKQNQPLHAWSNYSEYLWLFVLCLAGAFTGLHRGSLPRLLALIVVFISLEYRFFK